MLAEFRALKQEGEILRPGCSERPDVLVNNDSQVELGRNSKTQIADANLRRKCCAVYIKNGVLRLERINVTIWVNDLAVEPGTNCTLQHGDTIDLPPDQSYRYRVHLWVPACTNENTDHSNSMAANVAAEMPGRKMQSKPSPVRKRSANHLSTPAAAFAAAPSAMTMTPSASIISRIPAAVAEECFCALCLELQVQPTVVVPCGHSFCGDCIAPATECPTCRQAVQARVLNRSLNNVISGLVDEQQKQLNPFTAAAAAAAPSGMEGGDGAFSADDMAHYLQRTGSTASVASAAAAAGNCNNFQPANKRQRLTSATSSGQSATNAICID